MRPKVSTNVLERVRVDVREEGADGVSTVCSGELRIVGPRDGHATGVARFCAAGTPNGAGAACVALVHEVVIRAVVAAGMSAAGKVG